MSNGDMYVGADWARSAMDGWMGCEYVYAGEV